MNSAEPTPRAHAASAGDAPRLCAVCRRTIAALTSWSITSDGRPVHQYCNEGGSLHAAFS